MDTPSSTANVKSVLIFKADRIYAEALRQHVLSVFPGIRVFTALSMDAARQVLTSESIDLFITGVGASLDCDVIDLLAALTSPSRSVRTLVVTVRLEYRVLAALRSLAIEGTFDSAAGTPEELTLALKTLAQGKRYWSQSVLDHMHRVGSASDALFRLLTTFEQVVLSVIGDGCDNVVAAQKLNLSPATVSTVRRELHRKLGVQHRGELVRVAAQHGFVRFTAAGIVRPGFALMCASYKARRTKRGLSRSKTASNR
jgi:DNA-binding NarL/FixJ family response regulator